MEFLATSWLLLLQVGVVVVVVVLLPYLAYRPTLVAHLRARSLGWWKDEKFEQW